MTPDELAAIEARAAAATPGPWQVDDANTGGARSFWMVVNDAFLNPPADDDAPWIAVELHTGIEADAIFIAAARTDVPALIEALREVTAERDRLHAAVRPGEWRLTRDGPQTDLQVTVGAWMEYVRTGDEALIANMSPDGMRALLRQWADAERCPVCTPAAPGICPRCGGSGDIGTFGPSGFEECPVCDGMGDCSGCVL